MAGTDNNYFITTPLGARDWSIIQNDNLWQGVNGLNNPCPSGFRVPTKSEWDSEKTSWSQPNGIGAFASPLKLPVGGARSLSTGDFSNVGTTGYYWSSTVSKTSVNLMFFLSNYSTSYTDSRSPGSSVRCIKD